MKIKCVRRKVITYKCVGLASNANMMILKKNCNIML